MAWEWVAPVAVSASGCVGVFFTWLTGSQSRKQLDKITERTDARTDRERSVIERRNAYLAVLRMARLDMQRMRYDERGEASKLEEVDRTWPKGERVRLVIEAKIGVEAFGSPAARALVDRAVDVYAAKSEEAYRAVYEQFLVIVRRELGTEALSDEAAVQDTHEQA